MKPSPSIVSAPLLGLVLAAGCCGVCLAAGGGEPTGLPDATIQPKDVVGSMGALRGWFRAPPPADAGDEVAAPPEPPKQSLFGSDHTPSYELPAVEVQGQPGSSLREEDRVGSYQQPRWTASRRFPGTRVYVIPEGQVEAEVWARTTINRTDQGGNTELRTLQEFEVGLPYRFQLDLYLRQDWDSAEDEVSWGGQIEARWALANWGVIPGNPALYLEYAPLENAPDTIETKLLLGDEIAEGWHAAANLSFEQELSGSRASEYQVTAGVSRTVLDEKFSIGAETVFEATDEHGDRGHFKTSVVVGPSFQWRPVRNATINIAPLFGVTNESPFMEIFFNAGWEF